MNSVFLWTPNNLIHRGKQRRPARACWTKLKSQSSQSSVALKKRLFVSGEFLLLVSSRAASTHVHQERPVTVTHRGIVGKQGGATLCSGRCSDTRPTNQNKTLRQNLNAWPTGIKAGRQQWWISDRAVYKTDNVWLQTLTQHEHVRSTCYPTNLKPPRLQKLHPWRHWNTSR